MPEIVIVCPEVETEPTVLLVKPLSVPIVDGCDQPLGTSSVIEPFDIPPAAAVYVNTIAFPVEPLRTKVGLAVTEPSPSAEYTVNGFEPPVWGPNEFWTKMPDAGPPVVSVRAWMRTPLVKVSVVNGCPPAMVRLESTS